ncbi:MAG: type II toxin-antitoxin system Phd/YefM family antitoxin [Ectothiorhodospiraceae bacterium]|nr:type II toxin-antitoxin system Phd/YefM family antitoxin [Ectothiorhodospiraceae bacterium]
MANIISAQEIKRRGIGAVDEALKEGPVHVVRRNRAQYVILTEEDYQRLTAGQASQSQLWDRLLATPPQTTGRSRTAMDQALEEERSSWGR